MDRFFLFLIFFGSVEIPDLTSLPETHDEPVFDGYRKGGCRSGGGEAPKNVMKTMISTEPFLSFFHLHVFKVLSPSDSVAQIPSCPVISILNRYI